ncbi:MAG TPA: trypsin-like serine protease [Clostridiaceae bacterium]|nr:trypsin-like serine protease [Clostridiaceae bacterium]
MNNADKEDKQEPIGVNDNSASSAQSSESKKEKFESTGPASSQEYGDLNAGTPGFGAYNNSGPDGYQPYTDPRRNQASQQESEYRWSRQSGSPMPGSTDVSGYRSTQQPNNNDNKKNKAGVKAVVIVLAVLVALGIAFISILGTLVYTLNYQKSETRVDEDENIESASPTEIEVTTNEREQSTSIDSAEPSRGEPDIKTVTPEEASPSGQLQDAAEKVIPSVVLVRQLRKPSMGQNTALIPGSSGTLSQKNPLWGRERRDLIVGEGSGVIMSEDGYIVTNAHVVEGGESYEVVLYDGTALEAQLMGTDFVTDLAVLKIEPGDTELKAATFAGTSGLRVADQVIAVGNPTGSVLSSSVSVGYISALNRMIMAEDGSNMNYIQTDAAINRGNSGGALANLKGEVIGINTLKVGGDTYEGLGFAIPWDAAEPVVRDLARYGKVQNRPALGIRGRFMDLRSAMYYQLPNAGFFVDEVINKDLIKEGLKQGSIITAIDGLDLVTDSTLANYLAQKNPGDVVTLEVVDGRTGSTFTVKVKLISSHDLG